MEKFQRQLELENEGIHAGIKAYRDSVQAGKIGELPPGVAMMKHAMEPMINAIEEFLKPARGASRMAAVKEFLKRVQVSNEELAFLTLKTCLQSIGGKVKLQTAAINLTGMIVDQHEYAKFKSAHKGYLKRMEQDLSVASQRHRRTVVMLKKRALGVNDDRFEQEDRLVVGCKLIELCILATGLIEKTLVNDVYVLQGSEKAEAWVDRVNDRCELLNPVLLPMIITPKAWTGVEGGGYFSNVATLKFKIVKTRNRKALTELATHAMPQVYEALNTIQDTPWRINKRVYEVMEALWTGGSTLGGLPERERKELPRKPWSSDEEFERMKVEQPEAVIAWKRAASNIYEGFIRNKSKRTAAAMKLRTADRFLEEVQMFFPHVLDWRCRVYPVTSYVNPQSDDLGKGLIEFSKGLPTGEAGLRWIKIQLANTYGYDKAPFEDRIKWVDAHEKEILDSADNPLDGYRFWCAVDEEGRPLADSPYCFLAACFEYADYLKDPQGHITHLPIAQDGSCSGLQHFSAMLLDSVGGSAVNLLPSETPQDIYMRVADRVIDIVNRDAAEGNESAKAWQGKIDRTITKRAVMTSPYGAKKFGFKDQLLQELKKRGEDYLGQADNYTACIYLAEKLWEAIGQVVIAARDAMEWLQEVAKVVSEADIPLRWTTPIGFKARQEYLKVSTKRVCTFWGSTRVELTLATDTDKMDSRKQANGIAPNFVHSMDGSHLMKTVLACKAQGITDFAMIHDSFGTHACNSDILAVTLRDTFVEQYSGDVLEAFRTEVVSQLSEELQAKLPPVPLKGNLDLEAVKLSKYFFA